MSQVCHLTYDKSYKTQYEKSISRNKLDLQTNYISSTSEQSYKSKRLTRENENESLLFPNTINPSDGKYYSQEKIINSSKESFPISTLVLRNDARKKQRVLKRPYEKDLFSVGKNTLLCKNKNTLHRTKIFMPMAQNIYRETKNTNINCINYITSNLNHREDKCQPKTVGLTFSKMKTINNEDLLIGPMYRSFFCNPIIPELCDNANGKEDINMKNKLYTSYSEHMVTIVNHKSEMRLLQMYHPKICYLCCSIEEKKNLKRSISAIRYNRSTQCIFNIKNNNSYLHISQSKHNNLNNNRRYNVQCSFEDINCLSMPEENSWSIKTCKEKENKRYMEAEYDCKIKYSWQIIGTSSQTSKVLLDNVLEDNQSQFSNHNNESSTYKCEVKYSWQIVGTGTQVALQNSNDTDYWTGVIFSPDIHQNRKAVIDKKKKNTYNDIELCELQACRKKRIILNNQSIQTLAEKKTQTDILDCKVKYFWQNLILRQL